MTARYSYYPISQILFLFGAEIFNTSALFLGGKTMVQLFSFSFISIPLIYLLLRYTCILKIFCYSKATGREERRRRDEPSWKSQSSNTFWDGREKRREDTNLDQVLYLSVLSSYFPGGKAYLGRHFLLKIFSFLVEVLKYYRQIRRGRKKSMAAVSSW